MNSMHDDNGPIVLHREFRQIIATIERYLRLSEEAHEPMCMALEGCTGAGKTTLIKSFMNNYRNENGPESVFYVMTPANVTVKGMASRMLQELGDPQFDRGSQAAMDARLQKYLKSRNVRLVILDDIQHMIPNAKTSTNGRVSSVSEWLKVHIKEVNIPFLIISVEGRVDDLLDEDVDSNKQLSRLFVTKMILKPFPFRTTEEMQEFSLFVQFLLEKLNISFPEDNDEKAKLIIGIHEVTNGVANHVHKLLLISSEKLKGQGESVLTAQVLSEVSELRLFKMVSSRNPFIQDKMSSK